MKINKRLKNIIASGQCRFSIRKKSDKLKGIFFALSQNTKKKILRKEFLKRDVAQLLLK